MTRKEYNGWYNYETWLFNIHWDNAFTEEAQDAWNNAKACHNFSRQKNAAFELADRIKETAEEVMQESLTGNNVWIDDLIKSSFSEIKFHEIAQHYIAELDTGEGE